MLKASSTQVCWIILIQFTATFVLSALLLVFGWVYAWSGLTGGLIATLAHGYFAWKVFGKQLDTEPEHILATCYGAEVGKIILTIMMFMAAIVMIKPLSIVTLMGMYLFNHMIPWLASFYINEDDLIRRNNNGG